MTPAEFITTAEQLYATIEDILDHMIDEELAALDYESGSGVITIDCEDTGTKIIISRQQATQQIWVAAKSGGFHLNHVVDEQRPGKVLWVCTKTQETLQALITRVYSEQSHQTVVFEGIDG